MPRWPFRFSSTAVTLALALGAAACQTSSDRDAVPTSDDVVDSAVPGTATGDTPTADTSTVGSSSGPASTGTDPAPESGPDEGNFPTTPTEPLDNSGLADFIDLDRSVRAGTLDNGLQYVVRHNDNPGDRVEMRLAIDAGSGLQLADQGGQAHFLEHMLFNGTERYPENDLVAALRSFGSSFGADVNASTNYDETVYRLTMPAYDPAVVTSGFDILREWLSAATIDPAQVDAETGVVLEEWRNSDQSVNGRLFTNIARLFLESSPYDNKRPIGTDTEISATTAESLRSFYDDWYRPDNAAVVVVGDIPVGDLEAQVIEMFSDLEARGPAAERPSLAFDPSQQARAIVMDDPDLVEGISFVTLPTAIEPTWSVDQAQREISTSLVFDIIATRLSNDALRGEAPFDEATVDSSAFVRGIEAPEIYLTASGDVLTESVRAVLEEYERVRRFGFNAEEVERAVSNARSRVQLDYDGRFSRQDSSFANYYVEHFMVGKPLITAEDRYGFDTAVLDRVTPENLAGVFVDRYEAAAPHIFVAAPTSDAADLATADEIIELIDEVRRTPLEPRAAEAAAATALMTAPEPVEESNVSQLANGEFVSFVAPTLLSFPNGVRVAINRTQIVEGVVDVAGLSPGGTSVLDDSDVATAEIAADVVDQSGVGDFDPVALEAFLAGKQVNLDAYIGVFTEGFTGSTTTADLETLFQLIHLQMAEPRVDPVTLDRYLEDELALASDPSISVDYARYKALTDVRYDDPRYQLPDVADLEGVDPDALEAVFRDRFGDASDWSFSFSGDLDVGAVTELARTYLATLPSTGRVETVDFVEPPPPPGVIVETTPVGEGDKASVAALYTANGSPSRVDDVLADMLNEVLSARLTDVIREERGESYSPFADISLTGGASPLVETFVSITTSPEVVDEVSAAMHEQIADLATNGVGETEYQSAVSVVQNELDLYYNGQINDEVLAHLVDPVGNANFMDFENQYRWPSTISRADLSAAASRWLPVGNYIEIRTVPR